MSEHTCYVSGTPIEEEKSEGPVTVICFLGIEIDTVVMELRLPGDVTISVNGVVKRCAERRSYNRSLGVSHMHAKLSIRESIYFATNQSS